MRALSAIHRCDYVDVVRDSAGAAAASCGSCPSARPSGSGAIPYGARGPRPSRRVQEPVQSRRRRRGLGGDQPARRSRGHLRGAPGPGDEPLLRPPRSRSSFATCSSSWSATRSAASIARARPSAPRPSRRPLRRASPKTPARFRSRAIIPRRRSASPCRSTPRRRRRRRFPSPLDPRGSARTVRIAGLQYTPPFASAEIPTLDLADASDFLPGYAPPRRRLARGAGRRACGRPSPRRRDRRAAPRARCGRARLPRDSRSVRCAGSPASRPRRAGADTRARPGRRGHFSRTSRREFPRVILLTSAPGVGPGLDRARRGLTSDAVSRIRVSWGEPSIFAFVKLSGSPHKGPLSRILMPRAR